ncbi:MAG TPA: alpha-2-macroglobulin family protein [Kofleriaceae bacterium]|nr:alpha-2-macroglobulin family protein [Kofleriaceae bacterium]
MRPTIVTLLAAGCLLAACKSKRAEPRADQAFALEGGGPGASKDEESKVADSPPARHIAQEKAPARGGNKVAQAQAALVAPAAAAPAPDKAKAPEGPTRAWFPETFLFEPLVVTDDHGAAVVPVRVPDRLTTWRVLALAHSRSGAQGGAVTSFLGTLPTYVDPVVPPFLVQGDEVRVPIQIVNTTSGDVASALEVSVAGATLRGGAGGARRIPAQGSALDHATLVADRAGPVKLRVALAGADAVEKSFEVRPSGRPVTELRSGTLAAPRGFSTAGTPGADAATDRVRLLVFPGALALLRSELAVSTVRTGVADDAYALLLAGKAAALLAALGDKADPAVLRDLAIVTAQRAIRAGRTLDVDRAALLVEPALAHPNNPVLARLGERAAAFLAQHQRPDGTFAGATGWTLQRLLVVTAEATRAAAAAKATPAQRQHAMYVAARAAAAFARTVDQVTDGFTAAAILASGAVTGELAETLRKRVRGAIKPADDGAAYLEVGEGVVRGDGTVPGRVEATALAVLALDGDKQAPLADLGTTLLGSYTIASGWGDGRVNLVAMQAVLALFRDPLPSTVTVTLTMDGAPVVRGTLEGAKLREVLALDGAAPGLAAAHTWKLTAEPPVPGLGYSLALDSWLPWSKAPADEGVELALPARVATTLGKPVEIAVTAVAPSGIALHIQHALPAGVQVDRPSLEAQVAAGAIERFVASDGALDLYVPALPPGKTFALTYRAIATLGGTLHSGASLIEAGPHRFYVPPTEWTVR